MAGSVNKVREALSDPYVLARFFALTDQSGECWNWLGLINSNGYGRFSLKDKHRLSHRLAFEIFIGEIPDGFVVCHTCDNRLCVNPEHLWLGTQGDNLRDAARKGRMHSPNTRAHRNGNKKLDWDSVNSIRKMVSEGARQKDVARSFCVSPSTILDIVQQKTWVPENA